MLRVTELARQNWSGQGAYLWEADLERPTHIGLPRPRVRKVEQTQRAICVKKQKMD